MPNQRRSDKPYRTVNRALLTLWWLVVMVLFVVLFVVAFDWPRTAQPKPWMEYSP